jgi:hypothetical protein
MAITSWRRPCAAAARSSASQVSSSVGERVVEEAHRLAGALGGRRAQQPEGRVDAGGAQPPGVLVTGLAERDGAAGQHGAPHLGAAAGDRGDGDHLDAGPAACSP